MNRQMILETETFLKDTFAASAYLQAHPDERDYRLEHSWRVANIAKEIARKEGMDITHAIVAGLLHDIAYCEEMRTREDRMNHGRRSASIARPFLEQLGLSAADVNSICYAIAIHVDDRADFDCVRTPFSETIGDADNIDRFDAYRIYETLQYVRFSEMTLAEKKNHISSTMEKLNRYKDMPLGTQTAKAMWLQRLEFYLEFCGKIRDQLSASDEIL